MSTQQTIVIMFVVFVLSTVLKDLGVSIYNAYRPQKALLRAIVITQRRLDAYNRRQVHMRQPIIREVTVKSTVPQPMKMSQ